MIELEVPDPCVVLLVGAAGVGKSTFARRHFPSDAILSSDDLRQAISGDAANQAVSRLAFVALHRTLDRRLAAGRLTVVDATSLSAGARTAIRRIARRHGVPVVAIVLDLPRALVRARNAVRPGRVVPDATVTQQLDKLEALLARGDLDDEGYTWVTRLSSPAEVDELTVRLVARPRMSLSAD